MEADLVSLGFDPFFEEQWQRDAPERIPARIAAEHRGAYEVWSERGRGWAKLSGRLRHALSTEALPGVGDWVGLDQPPSPDRRAVIQHLFARRTVFVRGAAGKEAREQVVAANVDVVFVVTGLDQDYSLHRIERYVARVFSSGATPIVVLSKADLVADAEVQRAEVRARVPAVEVLAISAVVGQGLEAVREVVQPGMTAALVGSSGAGKSTLVNALLGEERQETGPVSAHDGTGQHVTTHRQLVLLPRGGLLLDTPGMRELQLADEAGLDQAFDDVAAFAAACRFSDCTHGDEPGCAVQAAVGSGELDPDRLAHFQQLQAEARSYERRHDARLRKEHARLWGALHREVRWQARRKRGE